MILTKLEMESRKHIHDYILTIDLDTIKDSSRKQYRDTTKKVREMQKNMKNVYYSYNQECWIMVDK